MFTSYLFHSLFYLDTVTTNLLVYRTCYVTLDYNETECALLGTDDASNATEELETTVQPHVTVISMSIHLTNAMISTLLCLFIGPWSDTHGRKPVLLFTLTGKYDIHQSKSKV